MTKIFILNISIICGLVSSILFSMVGFTDSCNEMYKNIIRIRVIANSDSKADQQLKLLIRDAVLQDSKEMFKDRHSFDEVVETTKNNIQIFCETAKEVVLNSGFNYSVSAEFRDEYFETRNYDDFTLPAGVYNTLVLTLGEGKGENWWCVMYPEVCVGACSARLNDSISDKSARFAYNSDKYAVKFKTVEIFEKLKNIIK